MAGNTRPGEGLIADGQFTEEGGNAAADKILRRHTDVTAILCACDNMAIGAMHAAKNLGRSVPRDLSIIGFGNLRHAAFLNPGTHDGSASAGQSGADLPAACSRRSGRLA